MDSNGDFIVVGNILREDGISWGKAIVSKNSPLPPFGATLPYNIKQELSDEDLPETELYTLPLPLPLNNYPVIFAPEQFPDAEKTIRNSHPLNQGYTYDYRKSDGKRALDKITLNNWVKAKGILRITAAEDNKSVRFDFEFNHLIPNSLYTVMSLREKDLVKEYVTRPGPLGIPNVFITDEEGNATYYAKLDNPFPRKTAQSNRIINVIVLFMSSQQSYGGAIGMFGLGGDVHAQLKLKDVTLFDKIITQ